jgi:serine/threonine protein kinase
VEVISKVIGKELTPNEVSCLFDNFSCQAALISQRVFRGCVFDLYNKIVATVKSATKQSVVHTGYYFDRPLPNAYGQGTTSLQYVHYHCQLYCAKVGAPEVLQHEMEISKLVHAKNHCPTVMRIVECLALPENRIALVCPYYPATVAIMSPGNCSLAMLCNVALSTLASIAAFRTAGWSHNDIKPTNLMLTTTSQMIILIDFGSAVRIGSKDTSKGISEFWGRDCSPGTTEYDMACLASVLHHLQHGHDNEGNPTLVRT